MTAPPVEPSPTDTKVKSDKSTDPNVYVVQVAELIEGEEKDLVWRDVATVTVPPRTKRPGIIQKGLDQAKIKLTLELKARALDGPSAHVFSPEEPPPPPPLKLA